MTTVRYCGRCGAQIEGLDAWGHDDNCPRRLRRDVKVGQPDPDLGAQTHPWVRGDL